MNDQYWLEKIAKGVDKIAKCLSNEDICVEAKLEGKRRIDLIRAMTDEKLADVMSRQAQCDTCPIVSTYCMIGSSCRDSWLKFLLDEPTNLDDIFPKEKRKEEE